MGQKTELIKRIKKQRKMALKELEKAIEQAKPMVINIGWGKSPLAVVKLAEFIFQINMGAKQQYAQIDKVLAMQKMQETMAKQKEKQNENSPCGGCSACGDRIHK